MRNEWREKGRGKKMKINKIKNKTALSSITLIERDERI